MTGTVVDIALPDVPARTRNTVDAAYEVEAGPSTDKPVGVRIIDMSGEEILLDELP